ncbi:MAG: hypothetical protein EB145_16460 [Proteobacteria bacterium]|nr:hypothetical protein [Pseudomonadota bacterium]
MMLKDLSHLRHLRYRFPLSHQYHQRHLVDLLHPSLRLEIHPLLGIEQRNSTSVSSRPPRKQLLRESPHNYSSCLPRHLHRYLR